MARGTFGGLLKRERELRGISVNELTVATRIPPRFLEAFENEEWEKLPGGFFNRGFVRSIARYLGLDEENLLAEYDLAYGQKELESARPSKRSVPLFSKGPAVLTLIVMLCAAGGVVGGGIYGWRLYAEHRAAKRALVPPSTTPAADSAVGPANASLDSPGSLSSPLDLAVSTSAATRVRILADGKLLLDAKLGAGETRHFAAGERFEITAGDSAAVLLELNGRTMPPLGRAGASSTIMLSQENLRQAPSGNAQP